jgi:N,N'-diacetyllegionaminate synthase
MTFPTSSRNGTLVIAEIGVNHDGDLSRALELVQHAKNANADGVKLQIFRAKTLMHASGAFATYQQSRVTDATPIDMLERYELAPRDIITIVQAIRDAGLLPLATPFSPDDVDTVARLDLPVIKIASPDLVNRPLLHRTSQLKKPLLISTGAATLAEIETTIGWLRDWRADFTLLHCVSSYPTPDGDANLAWITDLSRRFNVAVGYSDHATDLLAGPLAVAAGATVIEKHLTYDRAAAGPDHSASADPEQFKNYVDLIRQADRLRGHGSRRVLDTEQDVRRVSRQSLVLRRTIHAGEELTEDDLTTQRPGTGIPAAEIDKVLGRTLQQTTPAGTMLSWDMLHMSSAA